VSRESEPRTTFQAYQMFMQMFGREATKILDYVECFPNGAVKGKKMTSECQAAGLEGFPTWFINGKVRYQGSSPQF